ncbi:MAG: hypothetical protein ACWGOX_15095, partial [Desulforhopalus sp.]
GKTKFAARLKVRNKADNLNCLRLLVNDFVLLYFFFDPVTCSARQRKADERFTVSQRERQTT